MKNLMHHEAADAMLRMMINAEACAGLLVEAGRHYEHVTRNDWRAATRHDAHTRISDYGWGF
jgi:hypothetical protein